MFKNNILPKKKLKNGKYIKMKFIIYEELESVGIIKIHLFDFL
jgi:hypothetical protein